MSDAEDFALHLTLTVGGDGGKSGVLSALTTVPRVHAFGDGDGGAGRGRSCGSEEREAEGRLEFRAGGFGVEDLRVVDESDAALFEIATGLAGDVVECCAETGDVECNSGRVGAFALRLRSCKAPCGGRSSSADSWSLPWWPRRARCLTLR